MAVGVVGGGGVADPIRHRDADHSHFHPILPTMQVVVSDTVMRTTLPVKPKPSQTDRVAHMLQVGGWVHMSDGSRAGEGPRDAPGPCRAHAAGGWVSHLFPHAAGGGEAGRRRGGMPCMAGQINESKRR